jgi:hypothetical protein
MLFFLRSFFCLILFLCFYQRAVWLPRCQAFFDREDSNIFQRRCLSSVKSNKVKEMATIKQQGNVPSWNEPNGRVCDHTNSLVLFVFFLFSCRIQRCFDFQTYSSSTFPLFVICAWSIYLWAAFHGDTFALRPSPFILNVSTRRQHRRNTAKVTLTRENLDFQKYNRTDESRNGWQPFILLVCLHSPTSNEFLFFILFFNFMPLF